MHAVHCLQCLPLQAFLPLMGVAIAFGASLSSIAGYLSRNLRG